MRTMKRLLMTVAVAMILVAIPLVGAQAIRFYPPFTGSCDCGGGTDHGFGRWKWNAYPKRGILYAEAFNYGPYTGWDTTWAEASVYQRWTPTFKGRVKITTVVVINDGFEELYARPGQAWFKSAIRVGSRGSLARSTFNSQSIDIIDVKNAGRYYNDYGGESYKG